MGFPHLNRSAWPSPSPNFWLNYQVLYRNWGLFATKTTSPQGSAWHLKSKWSYPSLNVDLEAYWSFGWGFLKSVQNWAQFSIQISQRNSIILYPNCMQISGKKTHGKISPPKNWKSRTSWRGKSAKATKIMGASAWCESLSMHQNPRNHKISIDFKLTTSSFARILFTTKLCFFHQTFETFVLKHSENINIWADIRMLEFSTNIKLTSNLRFA